MHLSPAGVHDPIAARRVSEDLLPEGGFTAVCDQEVVTRLLVNGAAFVLTGFEEVRPRPERELRALVLEKLDLDHEDGARLDLRDQNLLPCEVGPALAALRRGEQEVEESGEGGPAAAQVARGRSLRLILKRNPVGPHGARCLREVAAQEGGGGSLPPLCELDLRNCGLGVAGAHHLADLLLLDHPAAAATAAALEKLDLQANGVGDEGAWVLAAALPRCAALRELNLAAVLPRCTALRKLDLQYLGRMAWGRIAFRWSTSERQVYEAACQEVRAAWAAPLPDGTNRLEGELILTPPWAKRK